MLGLLEFDEALRRARAANDSVHLLLGNGFSLGVHPGFGYDSLYKAAKKDLPETADAVFQKYGITNFEQILQKMSDANWIAENYGIYHDGEQRIIKEDHDRVKDALSFAMKSVHPRQVAIWSELARAEKFFLQSHFQRIFSLCYDLTLYWVMNLRAQDGQFYFQDGFVRNPPEFSGYISTKKIGHGIMPVYFLHGALHLFRSEGKVRKIVQKDNLWILDQVQKHISQNIFPIIVTEGSADRKMDAIESSSYLSWAFSRFRRLHGSLFTYGTSLSDPDDHIREAISSNSRLNSLFVGIHTKLDSEAMDLMSRAKKIQEERRVLDPKYPLDVYFYDSSTAPVWKPAKTKFTIAPWQPKSLGG